MRHVAEKNGLNVWKEVAWHELPHLVVPSLLQDVLARLQGDFPQDRFFVAGNVIGNLSRLRSLKPRAHLASKAQPKH